MKKPITPVLLALIKKDGHYLLTKRIEEDNEEGQAEFHDLWQIPGGGLEFGESIEDGLYRECREEMHAGVRIVAMVPRVFHRVYKDMWHGVFLCFICELTTPEAEIRLNEEASEWKWFTPEEIKNLNKFPLIDEIVSEAETIS